MSSSNVVTVQGEMSREVEVVAKATREAVLRNAFEANPERFVRGVPRPPALPRDVWINTPRTTDNSTEELDIKF